MLNLVDYREILPWKELKDLQRFLNAKALCSSHGHKAKKWGKEKKKKVGVLQTPMRQTFLFFVWGEGTTD